MPTPPRLPSGSLTLLQVRFAVRPPRLEPAVAPRLHILVQLLYGGGVEQHLPRRHPLVGAAVQRRVFERVAGVGLPVVAQHPPQIGGVGEHGMHGVLAVAAEAVHVEPLPSLIDRIGYEEAVARAAGAWGGDGLSAALGGPSRCGAQLEHGHAVLLEYRRDLAAAAVDHGIEPSLELLVAMPHAHRHAEGERA